MQHVQRMRGRVLLRDVADDGLYQRAVVAVGTAEDGSVAVERDAFRLGRAAEVGRHFGVVAPCEPRCAACVL